MKKKLIFSTILIVFLINLGVVALNVIIVRNDYIEETTSHLSMLANNLSITISEDYGAIEKHTKLLQTENIRVTIVDDEGLVIFETNEDVSIMDNHENRKEIIAANREGFGSDIRYSDTLGENFLYVAVPVYENEEYVLRLSIPIEVLGSSTENIITMFVIIMVIGVVIVAFFILKLTNYFTKPLEALSRATLEIAEEKVPSKLYYDEKDEIGILYDNFNLMSEKLNYNINELEKANLFLNSILTNMVSGVVALNHKKEIIFINSRCRNLLDIYDNEVSNKSAISVIRNFEINKFIKEHFDEKIEDVRIIAYNEKTLKLFINILDFNEETDNEQKYGAVILIEDITEASRLEEMRKSFVANVTHELKTPLTSIKGYAETIKTNQISDTSKIMRFMDIIDIEAERLKSLIDDILLLSEIESMSGNLSEIKLCEIVSEIKDIMLNIAIKSNITINYQYDKDLIVMTDKNRMKQLLINLVENAVKYNKENGVVNVVFIKQDGVLNISVQDTGIGIEETHLPRIFERFYRVDKSRSRQMGGTGLGLAIVKHIALSLGGNVSVESKLGVGTTINVTLSCKE